MIAAKPHRLLSIKEFVDKLEAEIGRRVCPRTVRHWYTLGLPSHLVGGASYVSWEDYQAWQEKIRRQRREAKRTPRSRARASRDDKEARKILRENGFDV